MLFESVIMADLHYHAKRGVATEFKVGFRSARFGMAAWFPHSAFRILSSAHTIIPRSISPMPTMLHPIPRLWVRLPVWLALVAFISIGHGALMSKIGFALCMAF